MSGLDPQVIRELLLSSLTSQEEEDKQYEILNYFQICQLPDHYQMYSEPDELQTELGFKDFKYPNKRKWAQVVEKGTTTTVYICYSNDRLDRVRYPSAVGIESFIVLKGKDKRKKLERFKYLISKERADEIKAKRDEEHVLAIKEFESNIDTDDLKKHIKKWTKNYFLESGFYDPEENVLNMDALAESAYISILTQIFSWYYVTQDKTWEEILSSNEPDIKIGLKFNLFYDYYPLFNKFGDMSNTISNARLSLDAPLSDHDKISIKYNWNLVKYAKLRCPKMDIKLTYY